MSTTLTDRGQESALEQIERRVRDANVKSEPEEYFDAVPKNPWRTQAIEQQQQPRSQVEDKHTEKGIKEQYLKDVQRLDEVRELIKLREDKEFKNTWLGKAAQVAPTLLEGIFTADALYKGKYPQAMYHLQSAAKEAESKLTQAQQKELQLLRKELAKYHSEAMKKAEPAKKIKTRAAKKKKAKKN